jgi:pimeloyl-ACP methyl ester carboxylesterase
LPVLRRLILLLVVACAFAACSSDADDSADAPPATTTTTVVPYEPKLVDRDCEKPDTDFEIECFYLEVPENRALADERTVKLAGVRIHTKSATPAPDPVVYLHGGPGGDAASSIENWLNDPFLDSRDVVLYDQRGAGLSEPSLNCPEVDDAIVDRFTTLASFQDEYENRRTAVETCRARLIGEGIDLNQYDSEVSATDLDDLRKALQVDQWNLLGISYGTRLALTAMRSHPDGIRTVLLDSVYPTPVGGSQHAAQSAQRALDQLATGCSEEPTCAQKYGDVSALLDNVYAQLNDEPFEGEVDLGEENGGEIPLKINGDDALAGLFTAMYDAALIPQLPGIVKAVGDGNYAIIPAIAQQGIPFATQFSDGAALSTDCADSQTLDQAGSDALLADPGRWSVLVTEQSASYCKLWNVEQTSPTYNEPVVSDIPTLVFASKYDPVTPPADSKAAFDALTNATFAEVDGVGHGVVFSNDCALGLYLTLLDTGQPPDTACAGDQPPPKFA